MARAPLLAVPLIPGCPSLPPWPR